MSKLELYTYFRSSCSYRVRIALAYKAIPYDSVFINLLKGEQQLCEYKDKNPQGFLPSLATEDGVLTQSLAIMEYLDEKYPDTKSLLPSSLTDKTIVRSMAYVIACDIQPIQNLKVLKYLKGNLGLSDDVKVEWIRNFIETGFEALENMIQPYSKKFCFQDFFSLADICLIPQVFNAKRFGVDMTKYPTINKVHENCINLPFVVDSKPESQRDCIDS
ncbi:MAG: maleylacetoacetate isomerase [Candidatus Cloacimonetes bacterium]|nr:maleylacetoacetate isomerase [Candidatus Cloacimonadota bacterium]